jgi:hypothetical protein
MSDPGESPTPSPASDGGEPELLTLPEAAVLTGLSTKALTRRIERGTLPSELHTGRRYVRRGELARRQLLGAGNPAEEGSGDGGGELVVWRELYDRERAEHAATRERVEAAAAEAERLRLELAAIANAGPIRAMRLRRQIRHQLGVSAGEKTSEVSAVYDQSASA